jgi:hypothetical protein
VGLLAVSSGCADNGGSGGNGGSSSSDAGSDDGGSSGDGGGTTGASSGSGGGGTGTTGGGTNTAGTGGGTTGTGSSGGTTETDTGGGADEYCGDLIFAEPFEDTDFESRGWYDAPSADLSQSEYVNGSSSFECRFAQGASGCAGGTPGRHLFDDQQAVCLRYWVKYSANYVGSGQPYHPHEFHFVTNEDSEWVGPANTRLTTYIEQVGGVPRLAIQDSQNVDLACVLLNDDSFVGCDGDFDTYPFTEERSAAACNGLLGDLDGRDCFSTGGGYYSARFWDSDTQVFADAAPYDKNEWHLIESYWRLNTIDGGIGQTDGVIRYWFDGIEIIAYDHVLLRTGAHQDMAFNQFLVAPYIGDGSPVEQFMWVDDLEVREGL